jgi:hypothetical protein
MIRGIDVDCGCFGSFHRKVDYVMVLTDVFLLYLALNIFLPFRKSAPET